MYGSNTKSHIDDEEIFSLALRGTLRGRPTNQQVSDIAILGIVQYLTSNSTEKKRGVSITQIATQLAGHSYYDVYKSVMRLIDTKQLRRLNPGTKSGESARIVLSRPRSRK